MPHILTHAHTHTHTEIMAPIWISVAHNYAIRHLQARSLKLALALFLSVILAELGHILSAALSMPLSWELHAHTNKQWDKRHMQAIQLGAVCCCCCCCLCMLPTPLPQTTTWCATESRTLVVTVAKATLLPIWKIPVPSWEVVGKAKRRVD